MRPTVRHFDPLFYPKKLLDHPRIFSFFQDAVGSEKKRRAFVDTYIRPKRGERLLDLGCGTAGILDHLPAVEYVGVEIYPAYIESAKKRKDPRCRLIRDDIVTWRPEPAGSFDTVLALGVLHHLNDPDARAVLRTAHQALRPGGRLVTIDGCYTEGQHWAARLLLSMDRGQHVRALPAYLDLASSAFAQVQTHLLSDRLRVPYTHLVMEMQKEARA